MKNDGGPAFPVVGMQQSGDQSFLGVFQNGMCLRDYFAVHATNEDVSMAAQAFMAESENMEKCSVAQARYFYADQMLKEREK